MEIKIFYSSHVKYNIIFEKTLLPLLTLRAFSAKMLENMQLDRMVLVTSYLIT